MKRDGGAIGGELGNLFRRLREYWYIERCVYERFFEKKMIIRAQITHETYAII